MFNNGKNTVLWVFLFFVVLGGIFGFIYCFGLDPSTSNVDELIMKYKVDDYSIPYPVADRYLTWLSMRTFFYTLDYLLTLLGIVASLMTVFYASTNTDQSDSKNDPDQTKKRKNTIVFLSLLSVSFTITSIFINPKTFAYMSQHAWRQLDTCIMETVYNSELQDEEKDKILIDKLADIEQYIESFEN